MGQSLRQLLRLSVLALSGGFAFAAPNHVARCSVPLTLQARMASRTEELFLLPPPVGADIPSRGVKGARPWNFQARFNTK